MHCKFGQFFRSTVGIVLIGLLPAQAVEQPVPIPVTVAESDVFEVVARLEDEGLVLYVDRTDTNAPVLGAELEIEQNGQSSKAAFRAERGDYLVTDAAWLKPLRKPGTHALAMTVVAGSEADLLGADLVVAVAAAAPTEGSVDWRWGLLLVLGVLAMAGWMRRAKGAKA